ncbi:MULTISPECIES: hypothetical protein [unclassified Bradyrhizobium]|uniref:hypothetical protein n=1 Tax=unclassified Bradyrhizobium TaxID=2631580 RepID=UPI001BA64B92|nr:MULTISPECIES: hypothetical protein [unclassified Bradyrhizobium]MBR1314402.1 hypothetical protein [Bradyrhizobium sp. AUGA SZCCT0051]MBR1342580.1 hypothetical protein [Bradyrhizobium sp. AUGA SZCCT0105]
MTSMGNGSDIFRRVLRAREAAGARNWLHRSLEAIDGDFAFRITVMTAGMLSTVALAFGLLSL